MPLSIHGCMNRMKIKQHTFGTRPWTPAHFYCTRTDIGSFEDPNPRGGGHHGRAVEAVDLGATLTCRSDYKLSQMRGVSVRPLTALGRGSLGKAAHRHFAPPFYVADLFELAQPVK